MRSAMTDSSEENGSKSGFCKKVSQMEEQCCNLDFQYRFLATKIKAMEKSMPALLAFQLLNSNDDVSVCNILDVINACSPYPDPSDKLARSICKSTKKISDQVKSYHEKIINAEFELEEMNAEINNLCCTNNDLLQKISRLEKKINKDDSVSLHSVNSEELECLKKLRKLAENEINMKKQMRELETREIILRDQMAQLLTNNFQVDNLAGNKAICACQKSQNRNNASGTHSTCECMAAAKKLFPDDDINHNRFRHQACRASAAKPYQNRSYKTNSPKFHQTNGAGSKAGAPCMCCKCDLGDVEIQPNEPDKVKETQTEVDNQETSTNDNILQKDTSPPENAQQPTVDIIISQEQIPPKETPPEETPPEEIPPEEKFEENPAN